jgi:hypothetical protein
MGDKRKAAAALGLEYYGRISIFDIQIPERAADEVPAEIVG